MRDSQWGIARRNTMQFSGMNNELTWDAIACARKLHCVYLSSPPLDTVELYDLYNSTLLKCKGVSPNRKHQLELIMLAM